MRKSFYCRISATLLDREKPVTRKFVQSKRINAENFSLLTHRLFVDFAESAFNGDGAGI